MQVAGILETCLYVDDLAAAESFYCGVLGLEFFSRQQGRHLFLRCGQGMLLIFDPAESASTVGELPPHGSQGPGHVALAVDESSLGFWETQLQKARVSIEKIIDWPNGGRSLYFRDPAGNSVELATPRIWGFPS